MTQPTRSTRSGSAVFWVKGLVAAFKDDGLDVIPLLREAGLDATALDDTEARFPAENVNRLWHLAVSQSGNPVVGLAAALVPKPGVFDIAGYAMMSSPDLRGVLDRAVRYVRIVSDAATLAVTAAPDGHRLCLTLQGGAGDIPWQRYGFDLTSVLSFAQWIIGDDLRAVALELTASKNDDVRRYQQELGCPLRFGAPANALLFSHADIGRPLPTAHAQLARVHERIASEYLARLDQSDIVARVRSAILERLADGPSRRTTIARALGMSERTLQRRLEQAGVSFRQLLDDTHRDLAHSYIERPDLSLAEVAYLLGFNDQSSFFRAARRWFGTSPRQHRLRAAAPASG